MSYPDLKSLFLSADYLLPYLEADDTKSFLQLFGKRMDKYIKDLEDCDSKAFGTNNKDSLVAEVKWLIASLKKTLKTYLDGYPAEAYLHFKKIAEKDTLIQDLNYSRLMVMDGDTAFFRSKKAFDLTSPVPATGTNGFLGLLTPKDLFHVPFEKRRAIGTNRYSIPGFPCIYLSDHLQTSWSECMSDATEAFHAICYRNHRPLYFVDLVPLNVIIEQNGGKIPEGMFETSDEFEVLVNYALVYPIICACHSKIEYIPSYQGEIQFKSEYIIPQLLMQWYRERKLMIDGIRYLSCTAEYKFPGITFNKHNYVVPVDECLETGYCQSLLVNFSATEVYSYGSATSLTVPELLKDIQDALLAEKVLPLS